MYTYINNATCLPPRATIAEPRAETVPYYRDGGGGDVRRRREKRFFFRVRHTRLGRKSFATTRVCVYIIYVCVCVYNIRVCVCVYIIYVCVCVYTCL